MFACQSPHSKTHTTGKVRVVRIDRSCSVHLCESCYNIEMQENDKIERETGSRVIVPLPFHTLPIAKGE